MSNFRRIGFVALNLLIGLSLVLAACAPGTDSAGAPPNPLTTSDPSVTLGEVSGAVESRRNATADFVSAQLGDLLNPGGAVKTGADGRARIDFADGTTLRVTPLSIFTITAIETESGGLLKKIKLDAGNLFIILNGGVLEVDTPSGQASVRGSYMFVSFNEATGEFEITCLEGTCTMQTEGGEITLGAGETASVENASDPPQTGEMDSEDVQAWLDENPEAIVVVTELSGLIGDRVWLDSDANGLQDAGEPGVAGVVVTLYRPDGTVADSTATNSEGYYFFVGAQPGDYYLVFAPPSGAVFTARNAGDADLDSDANPDGQTDLFTYAGGNDLSRDAGLLPEGTSPPEPEAQVGPPPPTDPENTGPEIDDFPPGYNPLTGLPVLDPENLDLPAVLLSVSNFPVSARPQSGLSFASMIYEIYIGEGSTRFMAIFYGLFPQSYPPTAGDCPVRSEPFTYENVILGNRVWVDADGDGLQGVAELGLPGVCLNLLDSGGGLLASTTTDLNGYYGFDTLPDSRYRVEVVVPPGFALTLKDAGSDDHRDSDFDPATARTDLLQMTAEHNMSVDAGLLLAEQPRQETETEEGTVALGDFVWFDYNGNGLQDEGERGMPNVEVVLRQSGLGVLGTTFTDINGYYAFTGLDPAQSYSLKFNPPPGFGFTQQDADNNQHEEIDSDVDGFGQFLIYSHNLQPGLNLYIDAGLVFGGNVENGQTGGGSDGGAGIGPVRSGRLPYKYVNQLFPGSCLAYAGKSDEVDIPSCVSVQEGDGEDLNANFLGLNLLKQIAQQLNKPLRGLNYSGNAFSVAPPEGCVPVAEWIMYYSSSNRTKWVFDPLSGGWQRFNDIADQSGNFYPSTDRLTGRQLIFNNVVVLFAEHDALNAAETIIDIGIAPGSFGRALLFRDGMVCDIFWSTLNGEYEQETQQLRPIKFVYEDGTPFPLHPGPTWVHVVTLGSCVAKGPNAGDCLGQRASHTLGLLLPYIRFFAPTYSP